MAAAAGADEWSGSRRDSGSGEDSLDTLLSRLPLTPALSPRKRTTSQSKTEPPLLRTSKRTIYTAGRPPWYTETGTPFKEAFVIGLCGGSASGKTTVANKIIEALDVPWVVLLSMDCFYKVLNKEQQELAAHNEYNFDHPDAFDLDLLTSVLRKLKKGKSVKVPVYDFTTHSRRKEWKTIYGANVVVFEGILSFANKELLKLLDMKVFVDTDSDIRLVRRLQRDILERGRDVVGVIKQYHKFVKPAFEQYIEPTVQVADIVVPRGGENFVALDLIVQHVHSQLEKREITVRGSCAGICEDSLSPFLPCHAGRSVAALASAHQGQPLPKSLSVLESTPQVRGMHTIIRIARGLQAALDLAEVASLPGIQGQAVPSSRVCWAAHLWQSSWKGPCPVVALWELLCLPDALLLLFTHWLVSHGRVVSHSCAAEVTQQGIEQTWPTAHTALG
ncbi:uridine-cytidine kinase-like 1 isoform X4 [Carettochelys insculpta]|uniref:uridine-cytidine kinase-like 1 isoform X4 n=1 Tax=Carettochelys insculpta TaxID=44489 RepID=UPI003EBDF32B